MKNNFITLAHGAGAQVSREFIKKMILKYFSNPILNTLDDAAALNLKTNKIAFTTDSYVVSPIFFNGGNIGDIALCGTVNDLSVKGAKPLYISLSVIMEEGLPLKDVEKILTSISKRAKEAGVKIVTGDTKVVERGSADKIFITTSGIGEIIKDTNISAANVKTGDAVIVSGELGEHGVTILNARHELGINGNLKSDVAPLNLITQAILNKFPKDMRCMRDLTRGGLTAALTEIAEACGKDIEVQATALPVNKKVAAAAKLLGVDPLQSANEGKFVCFASAKRAQEILKIIKNSKYGKNAAIIGTVQKKGGKVFLKTQLTKRQLTQDANNNLPRIC
ncbi:hydrogenase expression/formation protein HypE [Elusimicrobium posterum]|uniref:hydrogenase expression/formation protein HypE n=1 Tax=Elusimicrobium posterum TaxID=3116653 RepID=UPI003C7623BE